MVGHVDIYIIDWRYGTSVNCLWSHLACSISVDIYIYMINLTALKMMITWGISISTFYIPSIS